MFCFNRDLEKKDIGNGILLKKLGMGSALNAVHWDMKDGSVVERHQHPQEQFGYIIKGGFEITIGEESSVLRAGDVYYVPPDTPHRFVAIGETEAIDVFTPVRDVYPSIK